MNKRPRAFGLYDPNFEHDACGMGAVADLTGVPKHETVSGRFTCSTASSTAAPAAPRSTRATARASSPRSPTSSSARCVDFDLPPAGEYAVGHALPAARGRSAPRGARAAGGAVVGREGQELLGWRDVPVDSSVPGLSAAEVQPAFKQVFVGKNIAGDQDAFERKIYVIRRVIEKGGGPDFSIPSFCSRTIVYKGMLTSPQLPQFFPDLRDERFKTALALVHSRFSTNTFPSWELAHPYRMIGHNGEINTVRGNINWMRARESKLASDLFGDDIEKISPAIRAGGSDSATFDNVLELLVWPAARCRTR